MAKNNRQEEYEDWKPKTELGRKVKNREIMDLDEILDSGKAILEPEIVDELVNLDSDLIRSGQSKGKFGGGQRRVFRQTQKTTKEGSKMKFSTVAIVGDGDGHVGMGIGSGSETVPAKDKAVRKAKLNIFKIRRGWGSWEDGSTQPHSIPFAVEGSCSSVRLKLMPAPKGKGLCVEKECQKILSLAGIEDVWSKSYGHTENKINLTKACIEALKKLSEMRIQPRHVENMNIVEGSMDKESKKQVKKKK